LVIIKTTLPFRTFFNTEWAVTEEAQGNTCFTVPEIGGDDI